MTTRTRGAARELPANDAPLDEIVRDFLTEIRIIPSVGSARVLFRDDDGSFSDPDGTRLVAAATPDHPVTEASARGVRVGGEWPGEGSSGVAVPVAIGSRSDVVVWVGFGAADGDACGDDREFLIARAIERLGQRLANAAAAWSDTRRQTAMRCALAAATRFHTETSLHRALRLSITELADLAGALEASAWKLEPPGEPTSIAQANARLTTPEREEAVRRLVSEVKGSHGAVRVLDTGQSDHYGWCAAHGINRFLAHPIRAFDALYGVLILVNFKPASKLAGGGLTPGVCSATGIVAAAAAAAFHQVARDARAQALEKELRSTRRQLESSDRVAARLDLARRAAAELSDVISHLTSMENAATPAETSASHRRAADILAEFEVLSQSPKARLRMTSMNDAVHEAVCEVRARPDARDVDVSLRLQGDLPKLLLDTEKIRQMLVNLIEHGVAGTENREAIVVTRLHKGEVVCELRFPERQISSGVLESLFLPFSEGDDARGRLGLALADQIIGEHGGQLRARHEGDDGLCYWLSLPVTDNQERRRHRVDRRTGDRRRALDDAA